MTRITHHFKPGEKASCLSLRVMNLWARTRLQLRPSGARGTVNGGERGPCGRCCSVFLSRIRTPWFPSDLSLRIRISSPEDKQMSNKTGRFWLDCQWLRPPRDTLKASPWGIFTGFSIFTDGTLLGLLRPTRIRNRWEILPCSHLCMRVSYELKSYSALWIK